MCCQSCVIGGQKWQHMRVKQQLETKGKADACLISFPEKGIVPSGGELDLPLAPESGAVPYTVAE